MQFRWQVRAIADLHRRNTTMPRPTILVVDDEPLIRWSLSERLKSDGFQVVEADTGARALERLLEGVAIVLLDLRLPDIDGVSILRQIKAFDAGIIVIMLTAYASSETAAEALQLGAYHFTSKPFNLDDVVNTIERALLRGAVEDEVRRRAS
jgi:DNA-binding NtrC family response regulator